MRKSSKFEEAYDALTRLESRPIDLDAAVEIKRAINDKASLLVAKAASIVGRRGMQELIPDLIEAFDRFMAGGASSDKQCNAKAAIANALEKLEFMGDSVFLKGAKYVQMEPVFGGHADTAVDLRCSCAYGLMRIGHPDTFYILTDLLVDPERPVRIAAVKAMGCLGTTESELLLRLKVLTGDTEPDVISECFMTLMTMAPNRSLDFVARYLRSDDANLMECAALAIGGSHIPQAFDTLKECWEDDLSPAMHRMLLLPIALIRSDDAFEFLLDIVGSADIRTATQAVSTLNLYADNESVRKIREAVIARGNPDITERFDQEFNRFA